MQSSNNFFNGDSQNNLDAIWLRFSKPQKKRFNIKGSNPLFSEYIRGIFESENIDRINNLYFIRYAREKKWWSD